GAAILSPRLSPAAALLPLCLAVAVRACGGTVLAAPAADGLLPAGVMVALCACEGKAAGGCLADRFGARRTAVLSRLCCAPLLCLSLGPVAFYAGVFLFNIPMAITLCALAAALPRAPGLAFGLSTLALLCGVLPSFFVRVTAAPGLLLLLLLSAALCVMLTISDHNMEGKKDAQQ
ncbi:MAG: hypothetical protein VB092_00640, partial [Oscillospiraceae bacterium]|nr:hypothetical protein [Oscillospiraceae bacterium]